MHALYFDAILSLYVGSLNLILIQQHKHIYEANEIEPSASFAQELASLLIGTAFVFRCFLRYVSSFPFGLSFSTSCRRRVVLIILCFFSKFCGPFMV